MPVVGLAALRGQAVRTSTASPETGYITTYNAVSAPLAVTLPSLALCNVGANFMVCKDTADTTANEITFTCDGTDTFDDAATTVVLSTPGEGRTLQAIEIASTKYWKITGSSINATGTTGAASELAVTQFGATGDGTTDDTDAVQAAIDAASGIVWFPAGTYLCSGLTGASGVILRGAGATQSIIKVKPGTAETNLLNLSGTTDVTIEHLGFDGDDNDTCLSGVYHVTNGTVKDLTVRSCHFSNFMPTAQLSTTHSALYVWTSNAVTIDNCFFHNNGRAISVDTPDGYVSVTRCRITADTDRMATGIKAFHGGDPPAASQLNIIDNYVDTADHDPGGVGADGHGISTLRVLDATISHNRCAGSARGILVGDHCFGTIVSNNHCHDNEDAGIRVEPEIGTQTISVGTAGTLRACSITDNTCFNNAGHGITVSYAAGSMVMGNKCHNNGQWGIVMDSDRVMTIGNTVYNNCTDTEFTPAEGQGNRAGIACYAGTGCVFVANNSFDNQTVKTQDYGLSITDAVSPQLSVNDFTGNDTGDTDV